MALLCKVFAVNRSSYRSWAGRSQEPNVEQIEVHCAVRAAHAESNGSAGSRTVADIVTSRGIALSRYRAGRIMARLGLESSQPSAPKFKRADNEHLAVPNRLNRRFNVARPNEVWCGDITYIWTGTCWAYLASCTGSVLAQTHWLGNVFIAR